MVGVFLSAWTLELIDSWYFALTYDGNVPVFSTPMDYTALSPDFIAVFLFPWLIGVVFIVWHCWLHREEPDGVFFAGQSKEQLRKSIQKRYRRRFWVSFFMFSSVILLAIIAFIMLKDSRIWYDYDPWFSFLLSLKNLFPYAIVVIWLGGTIILLFSQWKQSASDIVALIDSVEHMQTGREGERIDVPKNLSELGPVLQNIFDESCRDKRMAKEAEQKKNDLILYLAHDLKTPLTSVIGYLNLLKDSEDLTDEQKQEFTRIAWEKSLRLEDLIEQFFEISRFSLSEIELNLSTFSLNFLLAQLVDEFYPLLKEQERAVSLDIEGSLEITGDADRLARVFNNLFKNAIAYSYEGSTISLSAESREGFVCISFANTGEDISEQELSLIFQKFFRLDEARTTGSAGAGLGLAIAQEIVTLHGGSIRATSAQQQTVFTVILPERLP